MVKSNIEFIDNGLIKKKHNDYIFIKIGLQFIAEHRLIVEEYINRRLTNEETIHHIDFNRANNNIENLVIFPTKKAHAHFHRQILQFGYTNPRKLEVLKLKKLMELEREKNHTLLFAKKRSTITWVTHLSQVFMLKGCL